MSDRGGDQRWGGKRPGTGRKSSAESHGDAIGTDPFALAAQGATKRARDAEEKEREEEERQKKAKAAAEAADQIMGPPPPPVTDTAAGRGAIESLGQAMANEMQSGGVEAVTNLAQQFGTALQGEFERVQKVMRAAHDEDSKQYAEQYAEALNTAKSTIVELQTQIKEATKIAGSKARLKKDYSPHLKEICTTLQGQLFCSVCTEFASLSGLDGRSTNSTWVKGSKDHKEKPLFETDDENKILNSTASHFERSGLHEKCLNLREDHAKRRTLHDYVDASEVAARKIMENLMRIVLDLSKRKKAFMSYEDQIYLADMLNADVGQREHSRITGRSMVRVTAATGREEVKIFLGTIDPLMNHRPHLCLKADKLTDLDGVQWEMVNGRLNYA